MKILIVTARYYPETFSITNIAEQIVKMGHQVTVLTGVPHYGMGKVYDGYNGIRREVVNGVNVVRIKEHIRKKTTFSLFLNYCSIYFGYKKYLCSLKERFDIVISHVISPIFAISYVGKYCKKHSVPHLHYGLDLWPESLIATGYAKRNSLLYKLVKKHCSNVYNTCDCIAFASPSTQNYFKKELNVNVPFKQIYQPCLSTQPSYRVILDHHFRKNAMTHILFCGTIAIFNHLDLFIKAMDNEEIRKRVIFDVVGSGTKMDELILLTHNLKLDDNVHFHGRVPVKNTINYYLDSDVLFVPLFNNSATSKMIPQKVIEYFMYGKPILGMLTGDGAKLISEASSGNITCDQTIESLRCAILSLCNYSSDNMKQTGLDNYNYFSNNKRFKIENICQELVDLANNLIKEKKEGTSGECHKNYE